MHIVKGKALLLNVRNPNRITTVIPKSKKIDSNKVLVHWGLEESKVLRNLNIKAPSPIEKRYDWPGRYKPFKHQIETASFLTLNQRSFCFNEMGTGKTASAIWASDYLMKQGVIKRVLIVCPLSIMGSAWADEIFQVAMHRTVTIAHHTKADKRKELIREGCEYVIINYEGVEIVQDELMKGGFDLIIADECFVGGTPVLTPDGKKPIERLRVGDSVLTSQGPAPVKKLVRNTAKQLIRVNLNDGNHIDCTPEHPFFTDRGWLCAKDIEGRRLISDADLRDMRQRISAKETSMELASEEEYKQWADLFSILRTEEVASAKPGEVILQQHAAGTTGQFERDQTFGGAEVGIIGSDESDRPQTDCEKRERDWDDRVRKLSEGSVESRMGLELPRSVGKEAARLSYELQARFCQSVTQSRSGSGRGEPLLNRETDSGPQKRNKVGGIWVESVSYIQRGSETPVYNVEVEGTPNYFVGDGYLVHNCSAYKNPRSNRWKAINKLISADTWLWMMTGTPAAQSPLDAFGLAKLVNPSSVPRYFGTFRDMVMNKLTQFKWVPKPDATETVHRLLQPAIRFTKEECLDLPPLTYVKRKVDLTPQQNKYYKELKNKATMAADGEEVTAANAAIVMNKLLQISAGAVYSDNGESLLFDIKNRYSVLRETIDESSQKVLVFVPFKHVIKTLSEKLANDGYTNEIISGGVAVKKRTEIFKRFQTESDPKVLIIQPQAAAHGVTLTAANTVVWWGPTSSLEIYAQANARVHRSGQKHPSTVVQLQGSYVEQHVYQLLDNRIDVHSKIVDLYKKVLD